MKYPENWNVTDKLQKDSEDMPRAETYLRLSSSDNKLGIGVFVTVKGKDFAWGYGTGQYQYQSAAYSNNKLILGKVTTPSDQNFMVSEGGGYSKGVLDVYPPVETSNIKFFMQAGTATNDKEREELISIIETFRLTK